MPDSPGPACAYAEVAVNSAAAQRSTFSYHVPPGLKTDIGDLVWVPFGPRTVQGMVVGLSATPAVSETRDLISVAVGAAVPPSMVSLARWMSDQYLAPLFDCQGLMLPPGADRKTVTVFSVNSSEPPSTLGKRESAVYNLVQRLGKASTGDIEQALGKAAAAAANRLAKASLLTRESTIRPPSVRAKTERWLVFTSDESGAGALAERLRKGRAHAQASVIEAVQAGSIRLSDLAARKLSRVAAQSLVRKGVLRITEKEVVRDPLARRSYATAFPPVLTAAQEAVWKQVKPALKSPNGQVMLLHGVTGSGKTELYILALEEVVSQGKRGIVLVPEISLTPQTIARFSARFPGRVAILHSRLTPGERHDEWVRIKKGEFDVVIGPRSALFVPQPDLGLIILDEEHEWTYKQQENQPRYHARDVAAQMAKSMGVQVILGSATPDVASYYRAATGEYRLFELPERIGARGAALPEVSVVDMREELKTGNTSIFSKTLRAGLSGCLQRGEQAIIFLNRRGTSTAVVCRNCGHVMRCKRCQVVLTYHAAASQRQGGPRLVCHQCNSLYGVPLSCPACMSRAIKYMGIGTEKVEEAIWKEFPGARTMRWDRDESGARHSEHLLFERFVAHEADILVGTQMIVKGFDLPMVTLVGVINADISMYLPDFRSGERTFQLLCQVAGRAGRGEAGGRVVMQTYNPEHYAIKAAASHDYAAFYAAEMRFRRALGQPPFSRLVKLVYSHTNEARCREEAQHLSEEVRRECEEKGLAGIDLIGPAPSFIPRLRGKYRWQLILRGQNPAEVLRSMTIKQGWSVDVDPVTVI